MSQAWLLDFGAGYRAAVGERELVHLLYTPQGYPVPRTPAHAQHVLSWQERLLPVFDMVSWLGGEPHATGLPIAGVFAHQHKRGEIPQYGALWLAVPPARVSVADQQACDLPEPTSAWRALAISCFEHKGAPVPILDLRRLYNTVLGQQTTAAEHC